MAAVVFDDILLQGVRAGQIPAKTRKARTWYRMKAKELGTKTTQTSLVSDSERLRGRILPGTMVFYVYDAKGIKTLPYYDRFPLAIIVGPAEKGFYGLNLHYLPNTLRAKLLDALIENTTNTKYDESTRFEISYKMLMQASKTKYFAPCFKHYLTQHVKSRLARVSAPEWEIATFLPTASWSGANSSQIYRDSRNKIK